MYKRQGYDKSVRLCPPGVVREPIRTKDKLHLTGKPVPLMEHLMTILPSGSRILDPFAGSGTTLVAARNKGHTAVGIELSSDYHRIATDLSLIHICSSTMNPHRSQPSSLWSVRVLMSLTILVNSRLSSSMVSM